MTRFIPIATILLLLSAQAHAGDNPFAVGVANHAFDHLGDIHDQSQAAVACGSNIIYCTGIGDLGYNGLPPLNQFNTTRNAAAAYVRDWKKSGIRLAIAYLCATSIVKLPTFDQDWPPDLRAQFKTKPSQWLQQDRDGKPLPSWYGGDYNPACMNNPDWRNYEKYMIRQQLDAGHDGIFFDNPTVHPEGCYCSDCMNKFAHFLTDQKIEIEKSNNLRQLAINHPKEFLQFRCTIARDFLADMRAFARTINPNALVTCNNSLNSPDVFFKQCRTYAYNIHELSTVEDLIIIEDCVSQPRTVPGGTTIEFGPVYEMLRPISHNKPIVAITIVDGDYHTPPNLTRLAIAEAAAHGASYLAYTTWPENQRAKMIAALRPQNDFLRQHADLLNETRALPDVLVCMPFRRWLDTPDCETVTTVQALSRANIQFQVLCEEDLPTKLNPATAATLLIESPNVLTPAETSAIEKFKSAGSRVIATSQQNWLTQILSEPRRLTLTGPPTLRAILRQKSKQTILHLLNLNAQRISSFEDKVTPAENVGIQFRCGDEVKSIRALTADPDGTHGPIEFKSKQLNNGMLVEFDLPQIKLSTIVLIE